MKAPNSAHRARRILVVDDEKSWRDVLESTLLSDGFEVVTATDGLEAVGLARALRFDLVITDMVMPRKEGIETIMELRALIPGIRIIAMAGGASGGSNCLPLALALGAAAVLKKPFERGDFIDTVRSTLGQGISRAAC